MEKPWYSIFYIKSTIAKIVWGIVSVLVAIVIVLVVGIMEEDRMMAQTGNWEGRSIEKGAEIWANNCYTCHGMNGEGGTGPALNSHYFFEYRLADLGFTGTLEDYVRLTVAAGRPSNASGQWLVIMPTWSSHYGGPLRDDQVQQVTDYVMNWESTAIQQTPEEDPFIPFANAPTKAEGVWAEVGGGQSTEPSATTGGLAEEGAEVTGDTAEAVASRSPEALVKNPPDGLGCIVCHNLTEPETAENAGPSGAKLGPNLGNLAENAPNRIAGVDAETYVRNSIVAPHDFLVPGYQALMPVGLADRMTEEELSGLVAWLLDPNRAP